VRQFFREKLTNSRAEKEGKMGEENGRQVSPEVKTPSKHRYLSRSNKALIFN